MSGRAKPRQQRRRLHSPLLAAAAGAMLLQRHQVDQLMGPVRAGFTAMRQAVATELQWAHVVSAMNIADAVATRGPVKGTHGHILAAQHALDGYLRRAMTAGSWDPTTLVHLAEIDAIETGIEIYHHQLQHISRSEFRRAEDYAAAEVRSAGGVALTAAAAAPTTNPHPASAQLTFAGV
ncbi:hypothetical protein PMI14_05846 [Acidovorax sp. CF316]|uniref:hypothetical protein n=1 Tax=Acidovorax sp. CF316 TaxID=1144317 RepID=UPI00026BC806|nr:hypothetical protein [Acidovorax sp. CF316]EJE49603.1 hypothetical protein PMI14_05846 [Acidovorax sp. CF316]